MLPPQLQFVANICRITSPLFLCVGICMIIGALVCKGIASKKKDITDKRKTQLQRAFKGMIVVGPIITFFGITQGLVASLA